MNFSKVCELPYGNFDGIHRVFKMYFADPKFNLFIQGYKVYNIHDKTSKYYFLRKLNELFDYAVIDLDSAVVIELTHGTHTVELANNTVEGFPKLLNANIIINEKGPKNDITPDMDNLFQVSYATALMIEMYAFIEKRKNKDEDISISDDMLIKGILASLVYQDSFIETFPNQSSKKFYKQIFPLKLPLTIGNLVKYFKLMKELESQKIALDNYTYQDILFGLRLMEDLPLNAIIQNLKGIKMPVNKTITLDFTQDSNKLIEVFTPFIQAYYKINMFSVKIDGQALIEKASTSIYRDRLLSKFNTENILYLEFDKGFFMLNLKAKTITYRVSDNYYKSPVVMGLDFSFSSKETAQVQLTLINN